jgi:hypothetical protein
MGGSVFRRSLGFRCLAAAVLVWAAALACSTESARASQLVDRDATSVRLEVNDKGEALLTYRAAGQLKHVLAWGAMNAIAPTRSRRQTVFQLDYSGGYGKYRRDYWKTFQNTCRPYHGPPIAWLVVACTASDGTYWALQSWQRDLPDLGVQPTQVQAAWELRLSHWSGPTAQLEIHTDWAYRKYDHLFGELTYDNAPQYGFRSTSGGQPLDTFGRNIYLDTFDSAYGPGWKRENSFLTHTGTGTFCYGFFPHQNGSQRPAGNGVKYRATVIGPGVTPDVMWEGAAPGPYDAQLDAQANQLIKAMNDPLCKAN